MIKINEIGKRIKIALFFGYHSIKILGTREKRVSNYNFE